MRIGIAAPVKISSLIKHLPVLSTSDLQLGLGGTAINTLIDGFIEEGHHVTVFTLDPAIVEKYVLIGPNLKIIFGHFRATSRLKWFDFCYKEFNQIKEFIIAEKNNIDIVNAHWSYEFAVGAILAKVPHLITFRDNSLKVLKFSKHPYRVTRLLMDLWVKRKGEKFCYNSNYLKFLIGLNGSVIPNPINAEEISRERSFPSGKDNLKICFIANGWSYLKNPEAALEAFNIANKIIPYVELHLIGKGYEPKGYNYKRIFKKYNNSNIIFRGSLSHNQLMEELKQFDIILHTSREESFGNILIEAMAKGIPVIAGESAGAVPWVLEHGKAGCLTDIENPIQIAQALMNILTNKVYYEFLSKQGIASVQNRFLKSNVCQAYIDEYSNIINNKL